MNSKLIGIPLDQILLHILDIFFMQILQQNPLFLTRIEIF